MKAIGIIPSRLESTRLPNKALVDICGLPMVVHVYKRCLLSKELDDVYVATDNPKIKDIVEAHGGKVIMTGTHHQTGTDRIAEAASNIDCDIVVNIQGDEALVDPDHIDSVVSALKEDKSSDVGILVCPFKKYNSDGDIKTVLTEKNHVMYFSRADIPSNARTPEPDMLKAYHIVPFRKNFLMQYASWPKGHLETIEFNEYLRILEKGHKIKAVRVESSAISVDNSSDLEYVRNLMKSDPYLKKYHNDGL